MENFEEENPNSINAIRRKLSTYKILNSSVSAWAFSIGIFELRVRLIADDYRHYSEEDSHGFKDLTKANMLDYEKFEVDLCEHNHNDESSRRMYRYIYLNRDPRFKDHAPIQYDIIKTPTGGRINQSDGHNMPLLHLCELIRLLNRLSNLTAFF